MSRVIGNGKRRMLAALAVGISLAALLVACTGAVPQAQSDGNTPGGGAPADTTGVSPSTGESPSSGAGGLVSTGGAQNVGQFTAEYASGVLAAPMMANGQQQGIFVSGDGTVMAVPDVAILSLGIEARAATVAEARQQAAEAMSKVMDSLKANGVLEKDIRTSYFNIQPEYQWIEPSFGKPGRQVIVGYMVNNQLTVKVRALDKIGDVIDQAAIAGGDLTRVQGISFTIDDTKPLETQAREKAVKDALAKAQQFADLTGATLGRLVYISESGGFVTPYPVARMALEGAKAADFASTPISTGEMEVRVSVQAVFAIE
ncbi:MAG: SIMPL domain-containing protein [Chloroflexi bacterium]|nr:SIMPL domain-containing protein [Chloroflexota bacterium]